MFQHDNMNLCDRHLAQTVFLMVIRVCVLDPVRPHVSLRPAFLSVAANGEKSAIVTQHTL